MGKSIKLNNITFDSSSITHNRELLSNILNKRLQVLYINNTGVTAPAGGAAVTLSESISNFTYAIIISKNGTGVASNELNKTLPYNGGNIY